MARIDEMRELFAYNRWANGRMLDAAAALPEEQLVRDMGSSYPSVRDTLVHVMSAEWVWLSRCRGSSPGMPVEWKAFGLDETRRTWREVEAGWSDLLAGLTETDLDETVEYRNIAGQSLASARGQILRHCVNHSSYHRGQVTTMLRQLGSPAPATDLILWYRTEATAAGPV